MRPAALLAVAAILALGGAVVVGGGLRSRTGEGTARHLAGHAAPETPRVVVASPEAAPAGVAARPAEFRPLQPSKPSREVSAIPGSPPSPRRPRSPLESSPGYVPPNDPESLSVLTGRREAPLVDMEFVGGASSLAELAAGLIAALNARDERALHALRVTRPEFEVILWREFPQSRPITNITADDAWSLSTSNSLAGASRVVGLFGGRNLELLGVESGPPDAYRNFTLHRGFVIQARDPATGEQLRLRFASTAAERKGRFKALIFKD